MLSEKKMVSHEEFLKLAQGDERVEYINGEVYFQASPSVEHQRTLLNIAYAFKTYFKGKSCEPFVSPLDLLLRHEQDKAPHHVQPDLMVICDKNGLEDNQYVGTPSLIVEIVSPTNTSYDRIKKFNLYMHYGVEEYWLINPKFKTIEVNGLNSDGLYEQIGVYKGQDLAISQLFKDLTIDLREIFTGV